MDTPLAEAVGWAAPVVAAPVALPPVELPESEPVYEARFSGPALART